MSSTGGGGGPLPRTSTPLSSSSLSPSPSPLLGFVASRDRSGFSTTPHSAPAAVLDTEHISVVVRVRPLSEKEAARGEGVAVEVDEDGKTVLVKTIYFFFLPQPQMSGDSNPHQNLSHFFLKKNKKTQLFRYSIPRP